MTSEEIIKEGRNMAYKPIHISEIGTKKIYQTASPKNGENETLEAKKYSGRQGGVYTKSQLLDVLGRTVKKDNTNKLIVFLCQLLTYTENDQLNISFNAPSSSGKSYLALEIASLFPEEDIIDLAYASPTSFWHTKSTYNKDKKVYEIDLERKLLIFLDMPHPQLLEKLRPVLSHDKKVVRLKITEKQKFGITAKDIEIIGHPSVIFCSASFNYDEQELTRFLLLSPETTQEKLRAALQEVIKKETDSIAYYRSLNEDPERQELKQRIRDIRNTHIKQIKLHDPDKFMEMFYERNKIIKPRHSRDLKRIAGFAKGFALLNLWDRNLDKDTGTITTVDDDFNEAYKIWDEISLPQDLGLPPHLLYLYQEIIVPIFNETKTGVSRQDVLKKHFEVYGRHLQDFRFRKEYIPMLENSGLITQEENPIDHRQMLIYPVVLSTIFPETKSLTNNEDLNEKPILLDGENEISKEDLSELPF